MIDSLNITIAIVGYVIVFSALVLLYFVFLSIPKLLKINIRKKMRKKGETCDQCAENIPGGDAAAIGTALYLHFNEAHDVESTKMTIKRVSKTYSPWSSKIHGLNNVSFRKRLG